MFQTGLLAASQRLPFLPMRAGLGSDVLVNNPDIKTVASPYPDAEGAFEEFTAVHALRLDVALIHMNRADPPGNVSYLVPDPYFDEPLAITAVRVLVPTHQLLD